MKPITFPMRLVRFLALSGVASRRRSEGLITAGDVSVNGNLVFESGCRVAAVDIIEYKGKRLTLGERCYIMLNKPVGYLCSASDPHADKIIFDLVSIPGKRLFSVGRLDLNSEGLLILTDDGDYAEKLTHPRYGVLKKYIVKTNSPISSDTIMRMECGVLDEGETLKAVKVEKKGENEYIFILSEGKKREIRRLVESFSNRVRLLRRIAIGGLNLGTLPVGKWRFLTEDEILVALGSPVMGQSPQIGRTSNGGSRLP